VIAAEKKVHFKLVLLYKTLSNPSDPKGLPSAIRNFVGPPLFQSAQLSQSLHLLNLFFRPMRGVLRQAYLYVNKLSGFFTIFSSSIIPDLIRDLCRWRICWHKPWLGGRGCGVVRGTNAPYAASLAFFFPSGK
jgi:hypothetical protein